MHYQGSNNTLVPNYAYFRGKVVSQTEAKKYTYILGTESGDTKYKDNGHMTNVGDIG